MKFIKDKIAKLKCSFNFHTNLEDEHKYAIYGYAYCDHCGAVICRLQCGRWVEAELKSTKGK